jgi:hypothetical protein
VPIVVPPANAPLLLGLTRDIGSAAGGATLDVRGWNFTSDAAVTIGGVSASSVIFMGSTRVRVTTPAVSAGVHDVVLMQASGSATIVAGYETVAVPGTTFGASSFSSGVLTPFTVVGTGVAISNDYAEPGGTRCCKCVADGANTNEESLQLTLPANSSSLNAAAGVWVRWHSIIPDATFSQITGQIKGTVFRFNNLGAGEWPHEGVGPQVDSDPAAASGFGLGSFFTGNVHTGTYYRYGRWVEHLMWCKRTTGVSGRVRLFMGVGGMLKACYDSTQAVFGTDPTTDTFAFRVGCVFNQGNVSAIGNLLYYIGNLSLADGLAPGI